MNYEPHYNTNGIEQGKKNCAVYTRKSTDERLDMEFNTLDAQRESCEAFIQSQRAEGWKLCKNAYDDGGYSGGSLDRPALKKLIEDIKVKKIQIVVVYKIDRLTRSLADFSKLVEIFDEYGVTFVSITQSFNTTTSMGRLTLNVLLSFAQFEREISGERIRDKIAASKKKGMWTGGVAPLGYKVGDRRLEIDHENKEVIRYIFERYLELKNVKSLTTDLKRKQISVPKRETKKGKVYGGHAFRRGQLYSTLKNPAYIGKIQHKDKIYEGLHGGIIDEEVFNKAQDILKGNRVKRSQTTIRRHVLQGLIYDMEGGVYSPTFTSKGNKQYCYYASQNLLQYKEHPKGVIARIPSQEIESFVEQVVRSEIKQLSGEGQSHELNYLMKKQGKLEARDLIRSSVKKIVVDQKQITFYLSGTGFRKLIQSELDITIKGADDYHVVKPFILERASRGTILIKPLKEKHDNILDRPMHELKSLIQGTVWRDKHFDGMSLKEIGAEYGVSDNHVGQMIFKSFEELMR